MELSHDSFPKIDMQPRRKPWRILAITGSIALVIALLFVVAGRPPSNFVPGTIVTIPDGSSTRDAAVLLQQSHIVRSASLFEFLVNVVLSGRPVIAGEFSFDHAHGALQVARLVTGGGFGGTQVRITIPEGSSVVEVSAIMQKAIPTWDTNDFVAKAKPFEGFLFPDTYVVFREITPDEMIMILQDEFAKKTEPLQSEIAQSGRTELQIITMASILEKEAKNATEARTIAGILWKRYDAGKPLQVDAPFLYVLGKTSSQLTVADLQKDGPYNTYTRKGLPAGPIGNPGLATIEAALHPLASPYLFYLHDANGQVHYATTYAQHLQNKKKYLP